MSTPNGRPGSALFQQFLRANNLTYQAASEALGVSKSQVYLWANAKRCPGQDDAARIEVWTNGEVPALSWVAPDATADVVPFEPPSADDAPESGPAAEPLKNGTEG